MASSALARPARLLVAAGVAAAGLVASAAGTPPGSSAGVTLRPDVVGHHVYRLGDSAAPPTTAACERQFGIRCYSPQQLETAYRVRPLFDRGITGRGRTIAVVDSFGSPTIGRDLHRFDAAFHLPDTSVRTITPAGRLPKFDPHNTVMAGWAYETTLDVEYAHAMAPGAKILVVATPTAETEGVHGLPGIMRAERYVVNHHLAQVISQSFGATENTFHGRHSLLRQRFAFKDAKRHHVTVLASSGDAGATDNKRNGKALYHHRVNSWPSSDPSVTSVGGTRLVLGPKGNRYRPDVVWNDRHGAGGGGKSAFFTRPAFQDRLRHRVHNHRGTPDVAMSAAVNGGAIVYASYNPARTGWSVVGGTSEASPLFSGIVALASQEAHKKLGDINAALYTLAKRGHSGIVDVREGNNSFAGVHGYAAHKGYDLASGLGTVSASTFVPALARLAG